MVLVVACAASYYKLFINGYFLADDYELLHVARGLDVTELFTAEFYRNFPWAFIRPAGILLWKANYLAYGLEPSGYYLTNLFLLIGCTLLVAVFVRSFSGSGPAALIAGLTFAVHPSHPDAASYLAGRYDLLCTFFYLASINFYFSFINSGDYRRANYTLAVLSFLLALLSKEMALTLPLALVLCELFYGAGTRGGRRIILRGIPFAVILAVYFAVRYHVFHGIGGYATASSGSLPTVAQTISRLSYNLWTYFRTMLYGINYRYPADFSLYAYTISALALLGLAAVFRSSAIKRKSAFFFGLLILFSLVPVVNISPVRPDLMGARYVYLPSVFFAGIMGIGFSSWEGTKVYVKAVLIACASVTIICYYVVLQYNNNTWVAASAISKAIPGMFKDMYPEMPEDSDVTFYNIPQIIVGAPIFLDNRGAMEKALRVAYGYPEGRNIRVSFAVTGPGRPMAKDTKPAAGFDRKMVMFYDNSEERLIKVFDSGPKTSGTKIKTD